MEILNKSELVENAVLDEDKAARSLALEVLEAGIRAVDPYLAVKSHVRIINDTLTIDNLKFNLKDLGKVVVIGGGKASGAMAQALEELIGYRIAEGWVNVSTGTKANFKTSKILLNEASHPIPDERGLKGAKKIIELAKEADENDLVLVLISGGGSALMPFPATGISLDDLQELTDMLLKCGATIHEINAVRKHLSELKGGKLAEAAYPATVVSLIISDVVGDRLDSIASGPTAPDPTTFDEAISILKRYGLWERTSETIRRRLEDGLKGEISETPKPGDKIFKKVHNVVIANNRSAALAACEKAKERGFNSLFLTSLMEGEARHVGTACASIAKEILISNNPVPKPAVIIIGGETTVTVTGRGIGGRNQELALSASLGIEKLKGVAIASIASDGRDGPTDAAGAIVDGQTIIRARKLGLDPIKFLADNDSYTFFSKLGDLIFTGPTGTNVADLTAIVVRET